MSWMQTSFLDPAVEFLATRTSLLHSIHWNGSYPRTASRFPGTPPPRPPGPSSSSSRRPRQRAGSPWRTLSPRRIGSGLVPRDHEAGPSRRSPSDGLDARPTAGKRRLFGSARFRSLSKIKEFHCKCLLHLEKDNFIDGSRIRVGLRLKQKLQLQSTPRQRCSFISLCHDLPQNFTANVTHLLRFPSMTIDP